MPYNSYRFGCEHVLLKRLSFLSKLSIILNCHSKKGSFLSMGEGVLSQTAAGRAGYTPAHAEARTCTHTQKHKTTHTKKHTHKDTHSLAVPVLPPSPSHWCPPALGQWDRPHHSSGPGSHLGLWGGCGVSGRKTPLALLSSAPGT